MSFRTVLVLISLLVVYSSCDTATTTASNSNGCMVALDNPNSAFNQSGAVTQPIAEYVVNRATQCQSLCCYEESSCNVAIFFTSSSARGTNCMLYSCHPTNRCNIYTTKDVLVFAAADSLEDGSLDSPDSNTTSDFESQVIVDDNSTNNGDDVTKGSNSEISSNGFNETTFISESIETTRTTMAQGISELGTSSLGSAPAVVSSFDNTTASSLSTTLGEKYTIWQVSSAARVFVSESPTEVFVSESPTEAFVSGSPTEVFVSEPPTKMFVSESLTEMFVSESASKMFVSESASKVFVSESMTEAFVFESPTKAFVSESPTEAFVSESASKVFVSESASKVFVSESMTEAFVFESPTKVFVSESASKLFVSESPTKLFVSESPTKAFVSESPTKVFVSESPTKVFVSESPTEAFVSESPTEAFVSESPTEVFVSESPTEAFVSESPTEAFVSESPTEAFVSEPATTTHSKNAAPEGATFATSSEMSVKTTHSEVKTPPATVFLSTNLHDAILSPSNSLINGFLQTYAALNSTEISKTEIDNLSPSELSIFRSKMLLPSATAVATFTKTEAAPGRISDRHFIKEVTPTFASLSTNVSGRAEESVGSSSLSETRPVILLASPATRAPPATTVPTSPHSSIHAYGASESRDAGNGQQLSEATVALLIGGSVVGCMLVLAVGGVLGKRIYENYRQRHYSKLDYLVNGMYS